MEKNYYEILEVNQKASKEVIDRVYKLLAKKYHPDLQDEQNKEKSSEKFKEINEAYQVLSDEQKRKEYDISLQSNNISREDYLALYQENENLRNKIAKYENIFEQAQETTPMSNQNAYVRPEFNQNDDIERQRQEEMQRRYYAQEQQKQAQAEEEYYKQSIKKYWIDKLKGLFAIGVIVVIILVLFQFPIVKNFFNSIYESNPLVHSVGNTINQQNNK